MAALKPSLVVQTSAVPSCYVQATKLEGRPASSHLHISSFRSLLLDIQVYSSSVKVVEHPGLGISHSYPVFCDQDKVEGKVLLDPSCSKTGRLTISLEGAFEFSSVENNSDNGYPRRMTVRKRRHVFLSSSTVIPVSSSPGSRSTIRDVLSVRKRPSVSSLNSPPFRSYEFSFELPRGVWPGEEMPSTFSNKTSIHNMRDRLPTEELEVAYRIIATWEPSDTFENRIKLEAPVLFQPDTDFQSIDGSPASEPDPWFEMPLIPDRRIPFNCAVTLPQSRTFSRCSSITYFVVFSTNTRSPSLIKEIAADATIAVSLIRTITITPQRKTQSPIPPDSPPVSDDSDGWSSPFTSRSRLLRRTIRTSTRSLESLVAEKPLPEPPEQAYHESRTLQTQVSVGFPKRPWAKDASQNLPDGLYKGSLHLSKDMLPSMDWRGISIKYYLDVSTLVGQDDVRAHVPIKVY